jgi:hypothetical protein
MAAALPNQHYPNGSKWVRGGDTRLEAPGQGKAISSPPERISSKLCSNWKRITSAAAF